MALLNTRASRKAGFKLALFGTLLAVCVLGLGAFTRLVDAGLGCPDWPGCYGHALWPETSVEISVANKAFPAAPVEVDKTWPEMVHRYFATTLGFITIGLYLVSLRGRKDKQPVKMVSALLAIDVLLTAMRIVVGEVMEVYAAGAIAITFCYIGVAALFASKVNDRFQRPYKLPSFLLAFIILQGLFGMWTVTLKLWPQVVTLHLLGGFTTLSLLWLMTLRLSNSGWSVPQSALEQLQSIRGLVIIGLAIVTAQIALGGWTTSNYAALACPELPTCQGQWLPPTDFSEGFNITQGIGPNYLGGQMDNDARVAIHLSHRIGAAITTAYLLFIGWVLIVRIAVPETKTMGRVILGVLAVQVLLGLGNIYLHFPIYITVSHNLGGALLLLTQVTLMHRIFTAEKRPIVIPA
jgi:cytochrome c oxidase assembly protein subunit 15